MLAAAENRSDEERWWDWFRASVEHEPRVVKGRSMYVPSPADICRRQRELNWLKLNGFDDHFTASVMEHDMPCFCRVVEMVERHGAEETHRRCSPFLVDTEYNR
jgi:hypothetical protein